MASVTTFVCLQLMAEKWHLRLPLAPEHLLERSEGSAPPQRGVPGESLALVSPSPHLQSGAPCVCLIGWLRAPAGAWNRERGRPRKRGVSGIKQTWGVQGN